MSNQLSVAQFKHLCDQFGKDSFFKSSVPRVYGNAARNPKLAEMITWIEDNCVEPFHVRKDQKSAVRGRHPVITFYFTDQADQFAFSLCFFENFV